MLVTDLSFLLFRDKRLEKIKRIKTAIKELESIIERWCFYRGLLEDFERDPRTFRMAPVVFTFAPTIPRRDAIEFLHELKTQLEYHEDRLKLEDGMRKAFIRAVLVTIVICLYACAMWQVSVDSVIGIMFMGLGFHVL